MEERPGHAVDIKKRNQDKCSYCRRKRIRCDRDRDGRNDEFQRCSFCVSKGLPCSPDYRSKQDPLVTGPYPLPHVHPSPNALTPAQFPEASSSQPAPTPSIEQQNSIPAAVGYGERDAALIIGRIEADAKEDICHLNKLQEFALHAGQEPLRPPTCGVTRCGDSLGFFWTHFCDEVSAETHRLFLKIANLALGCAIEHPVMTKLILVKLFRAADRNPAIFDGRKRATLLKILHFLEQHHELDEVEYLQAKLANLTQASMSSLEVGLDRKLADSFLRSSTISGKVYSICWQKAFDQEGAWDLHTPPQIYALRHCNDNVASMLLKHLPEPRQGLFNSWPIHMAAATGAIETLKRLLDASKDVDERDRYHRTPLFLAASNGHGHCVFNLLMRGASPNARDCHGHSAIEMAAQGGHFDCVERLVKAGASVNTEPGLGVGGIVCTSTPLQAAFNSNPVNTKLVTYLLDQQADPFAPRGDGKSAVDLAVEQGEQLLVAQMIPFPEPATNALDDIFADAP